MTESHTDIGYDVMRFEVSCFQIIQLRMQKCRSYFYSDKIKFKYVETACGLESDNLVTLYLFSIKPPVLSKTIISCRPAAIINLKAG